MAGHDPLLLALTFEGAKINTLSHYRLGRIEFAVKEQINLNSM